MGELKEYEIGKRCCGISLKHCRLRKRKEGKESNLLQQQVPKSKTGNQSKRTYVFEKGGPKALVVFCGCARVRERGCVNVCCVRVRKGIIMRVRERACMHERESEH